MDYFLKIFGDYPISNLVYIIAAILFLYGVYKKIEKYFKDKALEDKEKDERIQKVIDQAEQYPIWHQQSLDIQKQFTETINELKQGQMEHQKKLEEIEAENQRRERNKLRDRLLQSYRYYTSKDKNPMQAWSEMEADVFWNMFGDYEEAHGNGHMHTEVQPAMRRLEVVEMNDTERIEELMKSRK